MLLKFILVLLVIAMLVSLSGALKSLFRNPGQDTSAQTYRWLVIRVSLAVAILAVVSYGFFTGQLSIGAPWTGRY
ncbi:DUF2909 family protein [Reinekea sp. G2M2-21]|uniref:DUF2909 family protein n=1 Tax=Reinekea sp. G2M2-21 TaxID=2788942 RepID=UPI0018A93B18|nr:DUF2909 family protein [Reinekea sp. G2M2-21]